MNNTMMNVYYKGHTVIVYYDDFDYEIKVFDNPLLSDKYNEMIVSKIKEPKIQEVLLGFWKDFTVKSVNLEMVEDRLNRGYGFDF